MPEPHIFLILFVFVPVMIIVMIVRAYRQNTDHFRRQMPSRSAHGSSEAGTGHHDDDCAADSGGDGGDGGGDGSGGD